MTRDNESTPNPRQGDRLGIFEYHYMLCMLSTCFATLLSRFHDGLYICPIIA